MFFTPLQQTLAMRDASNSLAPEPLGRGTVFAEGSSAGCGEVRRDLLRMVYRAV